MKKASLIFLLSTFILIESVNSQSFTVTNFQQVIYGLSTDPFVGADATVINISNSDKNVMCERILNNLAGSHKSSFCWDVCYGPNTSICDTPIIISANGFTQAFKGDLFPYSTTGTSIVDYKFFDQQNPSDFTTISIMYIIGVTAINELTQNIQITSPYPNPADLFTYFGYTNNNEKNNVRIQIVDLLGKIYFTKILENTSGLIAVPTDNLQNGVYFVRSITNEMPTSTSKLIVSHK
jgi:hypothetical protein